MLFSHGLEAKSWVSKRCHALPIHDIPDSGKQIYIFQFEFTRLGISLSSYTLLRAEAKA